jgi:hypothetical protein
MRSRNTGRTGARLLAGATLATIGLCSVPPAHAQLAFPVPLPGRWSIPVPIFIDPDNPPDLTMADLHQLPFTTQNGFQWAPAPEGGTPGHLPTNIFALRLETPGNLFDIGVAGVQFLYGFAGVEMPAGTKISAITKLSFDGLFESQGFPKGGNCAGGSPRFQVLVDTTGDGVGDANVFVYPGPYPNFGNDQNPTTGAPACPYDVWTHYDLIDVPAAELRWDSTQLGGPFYGDQAAAEAKATAANPNYTVLSVGLVWDSYWFFPGKTVFWADNLRVNNFLLDEPGVGHACSLLLGLTGQGVCSSLGLGPEGT